MERYLKRPEKEAIAAAYQAGDLGRYWALVEDALIRIGWDDEEEFRALLDRITE